MLVEGVTKGRCVRRSRVVLASVADVKPAEICEPNRVSMNHQSAGDGDKKEFVAGESTKETVKTIAQGMPGVFGGPVVTTVCFLLHTGCGCTVHPAFPCALGFLGRSFLDDSGRACREIEKPRSSSSPD
jgi:hypothetical protein